MSRVGADPSLCVLSVTPPSNDRQFYGEMLLTRRLDTAAEQLLNDSTSVKYNYSLNEDDYITCS